MRQFGIDVAAVGIEPLGNGLINDSWRVASPGSSTHFVLQRINGMVFADPSRVMENITRVGRHLSGKYRGYQDFRRRCLLPHQSITDESYWVDRQGDYWRLFDFIADSASVQCIDSEHTAFETGFGFGRFVADLADLPGPPLHQTIPGFHDTVARLRALENAEQDEPALARAVAEEIARIRALRWLPQQLVESSAENAMPQRVVHNDTKVDNLLFDKRSGKALCVIDLDTVMPGLLVHDFGDMVRNGAGTVADTGASRFSLQRFDALTRGYLSGAGAVLTKGELEFFPLAGPLLALELASRFLTDYLRGNTYFKVAYEQQNLHRCRQQLDLADLMLAQTQAMQDSVAAAAMLPADETSRGE